MVSVSSVGDYAFAGCTALASVELPSSVKSVGACAFSGCTALSSVGLGSVESLGWSAFSGCASLTSVEVPATLAECPTRYYGIQDEGDGPFSGSALASARVAEGATRVPDTLLRGCVSLASVSIPSSVTEIGARALQGCTSLGEVNIPSSVITIESDAFSDCDNIVVVGSQDSYAIYYAITNDIEYKALNNTGTIFKTKNINNKSSLSGLEYYYISYELNDGAVDTVSPNTVEVIIPTSASVVSVSDGNGNDVLGWSVVDGTLAIPSTGLAASFCVCLLPPESTYSVSAFVTGSGNDQNCSRYFVGSIQGCEAQRFSLSAYVRSSGSSLEVYGTGSAGNEVSIAIDGTVVSETKVDTMGQYYSLLSFTETTGLHTIVASSTNSFGEPVEKTYELNLDEEDADIAINGFDFLYRGKTYDLMQQGGFYYTYVDPYFHDDAAPMGFRVSFTKPDEIVLCWVTTQTSSGKVDTLPAFRDSSTGDFVASGYFESATNGNPGNFGVTYITRQELNDSIDAVSLALYKTYLENLSNDSDSQLCGLISNEPGRNYTNEELETFVKIFDKSGDGYIGKEEVISLFQNGSGEIKFISDTRINQLLDKKDGKWKKIVFNPDFPAFDIVQVFVGVTNEASKLDPDRTLTLEDHLELLPMAIKDYGVSLFCPDNLVDTLFTGPFIGGWVAAALPGRGYSQYALLSIYYACARSFISNTTEQLKDVEAELFDLLNQTLSDSTRFQSPNIASAIHDPSGIVYEGVESNQLDGVTATIYYKQSENSEPVVWDASIYGQTNPQITNADGEFAWDVPKGFWQVRFTKGGYNDAATEWMEVPPEKVGLRIPMVSTEAPSVSSIMASRSSVRIEFSQYMEFNSLQDGIAISANGSEVPGSFEFVDAESGLCKTVIFHPAESLSATDCLVSLNGCASYNGKSINGFDSVVNVQSSVPSSISLVSESQILYGQDNSMTYHINGLSDGTNSDISVTAEDENILSIAKDSVSLSSDGDITFKVKGLLPGLSYINVSISGTTISCRTQVTVLGIIESEASISTPIDSSMFAVNGDSFVYSGIAIEPRVSSDVVPEGSYEVSYRNNIDAGFGYVVIIGRGSYAGTVEIPFEITKASLQDCSLDISGDSVFTGTAVTPVVKVLSNGRQLVEGKDFSITCSDNQKFGTAKLTISGIGNYVGEVSANFDIKSKVVDIFADANYGDWYVDSGALDYAYLNGLISGYSGTDLVGAYDYIKRQDVAVILWRMAGEPQIVPAERFADVNYDDYYGPAIAWARESGVINGYQDDDGIYRCFGPSDFVTREQLAAMLANYAEKVSGLKISSDCSKLDSLPDAALVDNWARDSIGWCMDNDIINGVNVDGANYASPLGNAWRASMASMVAIFHRDLMG